MSKGIVSDPIAVAAAATIRRTGQYVEHPMVRVMVLLHFVF